MSTFNSRDGYRSFADLVCKERRWIFEGKAAQFLETIRVICKPHENSLKAGRNLWRAQLGSSHCKRNELVGEEGDEIEVERHLDCPLAKERMIPDSRFIAEGGRANPSNFAYLYVALNPETAMAELRPWIGESISLALFQLQRDIRIVACTGQTEEPFERFLDDNPSSEQVEKWIWNDISQAFTRPVSSGERTIEYVPTQIIAEVFKAEGFDGIGYQSGLAEGLNLVLFDLSLAKLIKTYLYKLNSLSYTFVAPEPEFTIHLKDEPYELTTITTQSPTKNAG